MAIAGIQVDSITRIVQLAPERLAHQDHCVKSEVPLVHLDVTYKAFFLSAYAGVVR